MKKSLYFALVLVLCLLCSCGSSGGSSSADDPTSVSLIELSYSVPASWESTLADETDPETALCGNMHTDVRGGLDLMVDRYSWSYNGGYISAADELATAGEVPLPADYKEDGAYIPGIKYKTDSGSWCYIYEIETDPAVFRLTFTLSGDAAENESAMSAVLASCTW